MQTLEQIEETYKYFRDEYAQRDTQGVDEIFKYLCRPRGSILWHFKAVQESGDTKTVFNQAAVNCVLENLNKIYKLRWTIEFQRFNLQPKPYGLTWNELRRQSDSLESLYKPLQSPNIKVEQSVFDIWIPKINRALQSVEKLHQPERY